MLGELTLEQIDLILHHQVLGRIGCCDANQIFVVPITYAYDGTFIYGHSHEGMKIKMMRHNPAVCFEVDNMTDMNNWKSVIVWGVYEELTDEKERKKGLKIFSDRMKPLIISETISPMLRQPEPHPPGAFSKPIVFRIRVTKKTGRFETVN